MTGPCQEGDSRRDDASVHGTPRIDAAGGLVWPDDAFDDGDYLGRMRSLSTLDTAVWENLHQPGKDAPFKVGGVRVCVGVAPGCDGGCGSCLAVCAPHQPQPARKGSALR